MICENWQLIVVVMSVNVVLSVLHFLLDKIKDKTKSKLDNKIYNVVGFLQVVLRWVMASRK
jgi:hypothetical protein